MPTSWVAVYGVYYRIYVSIYCIYGADEIYVPYMGEEPGQSVSQSLQVLVRVRVAAYSSAY